MKITKISLLALAFSSTLTTFHTQADDSSKTVVNVYNWADYIDPEVEKSFEKETGINITYDVFDSNEMLEGKLFPGNTGYDVVVPSNNFLARQIKAGIYKPLDKSKIPNLKELDPSLMAKLEISDPGNKFGVPYLWASTGIIYNPEKVKAALGDSKIDSWAAVFDPKNMERLSKCGVAFLDSPDEIMSSALIYLGIDPNSTKPADHKTAEELLLKVRPYVTYFNSVKYVSDLANGNICLAIGYSGDAGMINARANEAKNGIHVTYTVPKEGAKISIDMLAIPADAKHPENAETFINYVIAPQNMARITNFVHYPNAVPASKEQTDKSITNDPIIYPDTTVMDKLIVLKTLPASITRLQTRSWTKIKTGQ